MSFFVPFVSSVIMISNVHHPIHISFINVLNVQISISSSSFRSRFLPLSRSSFALSPCLSLSLSLRTKKKKKREKRRRKFWRRQRTTTARRDEIFSELAEHVRRRISFSHLINQSEHEGMPDTGESDKGSATRTNDKERKQCTYGYSCHTIIEDLLNKIKRNEPMYIDDHLTLRACIIDQHCKVIGLVNAKLIFFTVVVVRRLFTKSIDLLRDVD